MSRCFGLQGSGRGCLDEARAHRSRSRPGSPGKMLTSRYAQAHSSVLSFMALNVFANADNARLATLSGIKRE